MKSRVRLLIRQRRAAARNEGTSFDAEFLAFSSVFVLVLRLFTLYVKRFSSVCAC
jgi:hypothetical protein